MDTSQATSNPNANKGTNVQVAVRCRPLNSEEKKTGQSTIVTCDSADKRINVAYGPTGKKITKSFQFDKVFGMYSTQDEVFEQIVRPIVDETLEGFNCTIFAYGQTGTGKTHTMEGDITCPENAGIVPRSVKAILEQLEASGAEFTIRVSFLELYNEELQDLLNTSGDKKLKLCEDVKKGVVCQNLEEITVLTANDILDILQRGIQQRQTAETLCNKNSSRSHSIFTMKIMIKESSPDGEEVVRHGQLNLVDLAGSECIGRSGAKNDRAREAGSINQSLLTLGRVITALVDHHGHIPYRDSKLTRLLQESLGGKAKTCIIATLSPSQSAMEETLSTLDYAHRAKNIKNQPTVNQKLSKKVVLKEYFAEIETLRVQLQLTRDKNGVYVEPGEYYAMEARLAAQENQIAECEGALKSKAEEMKALRNENTLLVNDLDSMKLELQHVQERLSQITQRFEETKSELQHAQTELAASDAVVREQVNTEDTLYDCGETLISEAQMRRSDVDTLLEKVDRFVTAEHTRLKQTQLTVSNLHSIKTAIDEETNNFKHENTEQAVFLQNGIADMLQRSHFTCDTLKTAIDEALKSLLADTGTARDTMTDSCDQLSSQLLNMNQQVTTILLQVQNGLSSWLSEIDKSMSATKEQLTKQQTTLDILSSSLTEHVNLYMGKVNRYMAAQRENAVLNAQTSQDLRKSLADQLDKFSSTQQTHSDALAQSIASQAKHMEESLKSLVEDLVRQSHSAIAEQKLQLNRYCETTAASREGAFKHFDNLSIQQNEGLVEVFNQLNKQVGTDGQRHVALCNEASQARLATDTSLKAVSGSVLIQKQKLEETVSDVVQRVDQSVKNGCEVIQSTSLVANKVVTDVSNASQSMSIKATESMGEFKEFLEDTGTKLSTQLSTHFSDLDEHMKSQEASLIQVEGQLNSFSETILAIQVTPTGATPKKQKFASLPVLVATRDHEEIKGEIREAASNAQFQPGQPNQTDKIETTKLINDSQPSPFEDIENLNPDMANIIPVDLKSSTGKELLSKSLLPKATRTSKSSQDSDAVSVLSAGAGLRVRSKVL